MREEHVKRLVSQPTNVAVRKRFLPKPIPTLNTRVTIGGDRTTEGAESHSTPSPTRSSRSVKHTIRHFDHFAGLLQCIVLFMVPVHKAHERAAFSRARGHRLEERTSRRVPRPIAKVPHGHHCHRSDPDRCWNNDISPPRGVAVRVSNDEHALVVVRPHTVMLGPGAELHATRHLGSHHVWRRGQDPRWAHRSTKMRAHARAITRWGTLTRS